MHLPGRRLNAAPVYLIFSGGTSLFFALVVTVNLVYQVEVAHLNPLQLVLVGTTLEIVCFLAQVPTGVLADVYSRRLSVILGTLITGGGFVLEGSIPHFVAIMLAQALFGIGATLTDGAEQAWITDEVGEQHVGQMFMRSTQIGLLGGLVGAILSALLANLRLNLPLIIGGSCYIALAVFLCFTMPELGFQPAPKEERQSWRQMGETFRAGLRLVRWQSVLLILLLIEMFYGLASEGYDRLSTAHFLANFTFPILWHFKPVTWFGIFSVISTLLGLAATELVRSKLDINNPRLAVAALFTMNALVIACILVFALTDNFFLAAAAFISRDVMHSAGYPFWMTWIARSINSKVRATVISMMGQMNALGQIVGGPPIGYIGTVVSLRAALVGVSIILSPVLLLFAFAARKIKPEAGIPHEEAVPESL